jgi:hypothetical protein
MKKSKVIAFDIAFITALILFLSTKSWDRYHLIIGFEAVLILTFSLRYHLKHYKITGKIY